jgi:hypothetical protein
VSPEVQASSGKGKGLEVAKLPAPATPTQLPSAKVSSPSSATKSTNLPPPPVIAPTPAPSGAYRLSCPLEDKGTEKRITDQILDITLPVPIRDILAVSPDVRKNLREMASNKCVTIGMVSINELSGHPGTNHWMHEYDDIRM